MSERGDKVKKRNAFLYVGNWGYQENVPEHGFGIYRFDEESGKTELIRRAYEEVRVGAACFHPQRGNVLYFVDERISCDGSGSGGSQVIAAELDEKTGEMRELNRRPTYAPLPAYVCTDLEGKYLLAANHSAFGTVTKAVKGSDGEYQVQVLRDDAGIVLYPLEPDGSIGKARDIYLLGENDSPSHPHIVRRSPDGSVFAVCDRGTDRIHLFKIDREAGRLVCANGDGYQTVPGSSPRYCVFHPTLPYLIVNNETASFISSFRYTSDGMLTHICDVSTLPEGMKTNDKTLQSDIHMHPNGRYFYNLIRGAEIIAVFSLDEATGVPTLIQTVPMEGTYPKGCAVTPDGRFLFVAAKNSAEVCVYAIREDEKLEFHGYRFHEPNPATFTFFFPE